MRSIAIRIGIIAVIAIIGLIGRSYFTGNAGDLNVGDCFDVPSATATTVKEVQHHPCDQEHGGEVFYVGNYPASKSDPFPSDDAIVAYLTQTCVPAYQTYTGSAIDGQQVYDIGWFQPTADGWKGGDQEMTCYIYKVDNSTFKGTLKK